VNISIRLVRDLPNAAVNLLHKNLPRANGPNYPRSVEDWKRAARAGWVVVASRGDEVVGVTLAYPDGRDGLLIGEIAVAEGLRGRGIGREMLQVIGRLARKRGIDEIYLGADERAEGLYRRLGWWEYAYVRSIPRGAPLKINAERGWIVVGRYQGAQSFFRKPLRPSVEVRRTESEYQILTSSGVASAKTWKAVTDNIGPHLYELDFVVPFYRQKKGSANCGPVCAKSVLEFFGKPYSVRELLEHIPVRGGTWAPWLYKGLTEIGMDVDVWVFNPPREYAHELKIIQPRRLHHTLLTTKDLRQLLMEGHLLIVSVNQQDLYGGGVQGHYVVVRGFKDSRFYIMDPTFTSRFGAHLVDGWRLLRAIYSAKFGGEVIAVRPCD